MAKSKFDMHDQWRDAKPCANRHTIARDCRNDATASSDRTDTYSHKPE
ncbi:MAG: hypothetical protein KDJ90_05640 [Nitratireductor sp.]|nr:hypothetical protein [Nitratireductor sp.]